MQVFVSLLLLRLMVFLCRQGKDRSDPVNEDLLGTASLISIFRDVVVVVVFFWVGFFFCFF